jgi:hypothetical protein
MMPIFTLELAKAHIDQLRRDAQRERLARRANARTRRERDPSAGSVEAVAAVGGTVLLATACAGGPSGPGVAGQGASSTPSASPSSDTGNAELAHAQCMRDHGISDFPDPQAGGGSAIQFQPGSDLDPDNPQYEAAEDACKSLLPPPSSSIWTPSPQELEQLVRFAQCMRAHGADVSDPDPTTGDMTTPHGTRAEAENDPLYQAAYAACKDKLPDEAQAPEKNR